MRRFSFLVFLALTSKAYGHRNVNGLSGGLENAGSGIYSIGTGASAGAVPPFGGGSTFGAGGSNSRAVSTGASSSDARNEDFTAGWPGSGYYGGFGEGGSLNSESSGVTELNGNAGGSGAGVGYGGYGDSYGGSAAVSPAGGTLRGTANSGNGLGAGGAGAAVGSSSYGGSYGDSSSVGSLGGTFSAGIGSAGGFGVGSVGSPVGPQGGVARNGVESRDPGSLARRRHAGRVAGAVVGTALGGLLLGGLIGHLAKLGREGRLGSRGGQRAFSSSSYRQYGFGYDYDSNYGRRLSYGGYRRRCTNCARRRRQCFGVNCS